MRRFLIWSALAAVIGLGLAGTAFWAYQHFYARFQPVTVSRNQAEIQRLLDGASWVSAGGGGAPLYLVAYRDNAAAMRYQAEEFAKLGAAGVEPRVIVFARPDREGLAQSTAAERATVAELWLTRDWALYQRWLATPSRNWTAAGLPAADGNLARDAVVGAGRQFAERLSALLREAGVSTAYPLILWRDRDGFLKACACADSRSWAFIRDDLDAPEALSPALPPEPAGPAATPAPGPTYPGDGLGPVAPVESLPAIPPAEGQATPPAAAAPGAPRAAPQPQKQDDATFF